MSAARRGREPDALLLDEMFSPRLAQELRGAGVDCVAVAEDPLLASQDDQVIVDAALAAGRVLVTNNVIDFERWRRQHAALGGPIAPLIYTSEAAFPRNRAFLGRLNAALEHAARNHLVRTRGGVLWLAPPPPEP